jgi:hypothetical protein
MGPVNSSASPTEEGRSTGTYPAAALRLAWHSIRLPILAVLVVLEPFVSIVLSALTVLGIFFALFFRFLVRLPHFPFWMMLGVSVGCATLLLMYYGIIRILTSR